MWEELEIMDRIKIKDLLLSPKLDQSILVMGWVRTFRSNRFIALNDGSGLSNLQVVVDFEAMDPELLKRITVGASIKAIGTLTPSQGSGQAVELIATEISILGDSDPGVFPLQPKKHSLEFLRQIAHLRFRTNTFGAIFRIRHQIAYSIHQFFNDRGFYYIHTPIITASDAEGAGEMFKVTTLDLDHLPRTETHEINFKEDFLGVHQI